MPGPDNNFWDGIEAVEGMMDNESGISPTLEGQITGKTLGEILHAKEASLVSVAKCLLGMHTSNYGRTSIKYKKHACFNVITNL